MRQKTPEQRARGLERAKAIIGELNALTPDWREEFNGVFRDIRKHFPGTIELIKNFIAAQLDRARADERARILATLPKERGFRGLARGQSYQMPEDKGYDECLAEVRAIINLD